jgi:hypothetical protein
MMHVIEKLTTASQCFQRLLKTQQHRGSSTQVSNIVVLFSLVALLTTVACNKTSLDRHQRPAQRSVRLREGEYLSNVYIEQLRKTRSPLKSDSSERVDLVIVRKQGDVLHLSPIFNFHDGGDTFVLHPDGTVTPLASDKVANLVASVLDDSSFQLGFESFKPDTYTFVKNADNYVARAVLVGRYKDQAGLAYEFREDGWAVFPDHKFKFEIGTDHVLTGFDYFMEIGPDQRASSISAFQWNGAKLQIFRTQEVDGFDEIVDHRPYLLLQPIR